MILVALNTKNLHNMPLGIVHDHPVSPRRRKRRHPRPQSPSRLLDREGAPPLPQVFYVAEVGKTGVLEETNFTGEQRVDVGQDVIEVDEVRVDVEGFVKRHGGGDVVQSVLDPFQLKVAHAREGLVDLEHAVCHLVESGTL